jgi:hypothetical protein
VSVALTFDLGLGQLLGEHHVNRPLFKRTVAVAVVLLNEAARHLVNEHLAVLRFERELPGGSRLAFSQSLLLSRHKSRLIPRVSHIYYYYYHEYYRSTITILRK